MDTPNTTTAAPTPYEAPALTEAGGFAEVTAGTPHGLAFDAGSPPFHRFL